MANKFPLADQAADVAADQSPEQVIIPAPVHTAPLPAKGKRKVKIYSESHIDGPLVVLKGSVIEVDAGTAATMVDELQCAEYTEEPVKLIKPPVPGN